MYLDPSFGTMLVQILVALIAAGGALAFYFRRKLAALFKKKDNSGHAAAHKAKSSADNTDVIDTIDD